MSQYNDNKLKWAIAMGATSSDLNDAMYQIYTAIPGVMSAVDIDWFSDTRTETLLSNADTYQLLAAEKGSHITFDGVQGTAELPLIAGLSGLDFYWIVNDTAGTLIVKDNEGTETVTLTQGEAVLYTLAADSSVWFHDRMIGES